MTPEPSTHPRDHRPVNLRRTPQSKRSGDILLLTYGNYAPAGDFGPTQWKGIDLDHFALWCLLPEELHAVLSTLRHDRPEGWNLFQWATGDLSGQAEFKDWREAARARTNHLRQTGTLVDYHLAIRELGKLKLVTCSWDQLVKAGVPMHMASFFLLHTRDKCDHVVLDGVMIQWVNENLTAQVQAGQDARDIMKNGMSGPASYSVAEYYARRTLKAAFPFASSVIAHAMVHTLAVSSWLPDKTCGLATQTPEGE